MDSSSLAPAAMETAKHTGAESALDALAQEAVTYAFPLAEMSRMRAITSPRRCHAGPAGEGPDDTRRWCNVFVHSRELLGSGCWISTPTRSAASVSAAPVRWRVGM